jgi:two-component system, response regulator YesN
LDNKENDLIKVVIVDDEYLERNLLKKCIDWSSLNMKIVGEAQDAAEALDLICRESPDVLFTDIQMPGTDGIGLSEFALKKFPEIHVVVLTGFDKFEYAQRSIKAGISDYLLKPIDGEEVQKTAVKLKEQIESDRKSNQEDSELKKQLYDNLPYLREHFFNELMLGKIEGVREKMSFLGVHFENSVFQVATFEIVPEAAPSDEESQFLLSMRVRKEINDFFQSCENTFVSAHTTDRIVILNNNSRIDLYEQCEILLKQTAEKLPYPFCIGIGSMKKQIDEICISYREALEAVHYRVAFGNNKVILYDTIRFPCGAESLNSKGYVEQLNFYIKTGLTDKIQDTIQKICEGIDLKKASALETLRMAAMNINLTIFRSMAEAGLEPDEIYRFELQTNSRVFQLRTLPETEEFLKEIVSKCLDLLDQRQNSQISSLIEVVKNYIRENYMNSSLSLSDLAEKLYFNPSYLSRTFKKKAGVSFTEYLMEVRMTKAAELMRNGELKAFEIATAVGIPEPNYFSTSFKKYTGVSVSQYRKPLNIKES